MDEAYPNHEKGAPWTVALVFCFILFLIVCAVGSAFSKRQTPAEFWRGKGQSLLQEAKKSEAEAWRQYYSASTRTREEALIWAQLQTEIRKGYEENQRRALSGGR